MTESNVELVRRGFDAAARGDIDAISGLLDADVRWHGAGDDQDGCHNRREALQFMRRALAEGVNVELLDAREARADRVLVILQRNLPRDDDMSGERPEPHGEILSFRDGKITEMVVYPAAQEAVSAAGPSPNP
jgi:ketosteroid isomerase-like protein